MSEATIRYYGWSALSVETADGVLLFDPFFREYCGAKWFDADDFDRATCIAVTHGHEEHFVDVPEIARRTHATVVGAPAVTRFLARRCKLPPERLIAIEPGQTVSVPGFRLTAFLWKHRDIKLHRALAKAVFQRNTTQLSWAWSSAVNAPFYAPYTGYHVALPSGLSILNYNEGFNSKMTDAEIAELGARLRPNVLLAGMQLDFTADVGRGVRALKPDITILYPPHDNFHRMMGAKSRPWHEFAAAASDTHPAGKVVIAEPGTAVEVPSGTVRQPQRQPSTA